ncbi:MAG: anaerobic ribonucleoside-triphosphate reductase activating protein [Eubacteriales bacterium]|nr:anaerobic ribonucleoside-triphosphate reductase activating protein [Eubacteriales bacterium]
MEGLIRIAGTVGESIVDGPGFRYTLFTQGCPHHCPGCHNPQTHDFAGGQNADLDDLLRDMCRNPLVSGVTFSGGEPFCQPEPLYLLAVELKKKGKHLMAYTGYTFEQLLSQSDPFVQKLLSQLDLLVDGPFIEAERDIDLKFRGSANQRVLDVPKSLAANAPVWAEQYR